MDKLGALRILLAATVVLTHTYTIAGWDFRFLGPFGRSDLAVESFFVISGFLIVGSYERTAGIRDYARRRFYRLYPAYAAVILACAAGSVLISNVPASQYFGWELVKYLFWNLSFLNFMHPYLSGVFLGNPTPTVNGSLWTIKVEVMFYCLVPLIVMAVRRVGPVFVILSLYLAFAAYCMLLPQAIIASGLAVPAQELSRQLPGQIGFFAVGIAIYYFRTAFRRHVWAVAGVLLICLVIDPGFKHVVLRPIAIGATLVLILEAPFDFKIRSVGDPSYGLYLFHFPIVQLLVDRHILTGQSLLAAMLVLAGVLALAEVSWWGLEAPILRRLRAASTVESGAPPVLVP